MGQGRKSNEIDFFSEITFDDEIINKGGFANIHRVVSLNGKENRELLVKVYHQNDHAEHGFHTIEKLHLKLQRKHRETGISPFQNYPTLLGLPFLAFMAIDPIDDTSIVGLVMYDLRLLGFLEFGGEQGRDEDLADVDPIVCSFQLAKTIQVLHDMDFIHSDLKPASILINPNLNRVALIDFDSGFHYQNQEKPSTIGSITPWSRLINFFKKEPKIIVGGIKINPEDYFHNEIWALNAAIFQFFTSLHSPYSFLKTLDDKEKEEYIRKVGWPNFKAGFRLFKDSSEVELKGLQELLFALKEAELDGIVGLFKKSFNDGFFQFGMVATPREWIVSLTDSLKETDCFPKIRKLYPSKSKVDFANEEILIEWEAEDYDYVSIKGLISKIGQTSFKVKIPDDSVIQVIFHNFYQTVAQPVSVTANRKFPIIKFFKSDERIRVSESPILLTWEIDDAHEVRINGRINSSIENGQMNVTPTVPTTYMLECVGGFGEISKAEVFIEIIRPSIVEFSYEINLDYGLENIDLKWTTSNAESVEISPIVGNVPLEGIEHVSIKEETHFSIIARGLYFSEQKVIKTKPFPLPIIKELMVEFPKIEINTTINQTPLKINLSQGFNQINFTNAINISSPKVEFGKIEMKLNFKEPEFNLGLNLLDSKPQRKNNVFKKLINQIKKQLKSRFENEIN